MKAGNVPHSVLPRFFLQITSLRARLECGSPLSWLLGFKQRPHLWRRPGWASPTAGRDSGIWQLARPSVVTVPSPSPPDRTGQVGRSQRPHSKLGSTPPACGCLVGGMLVIFGDQDSWWRGGGWGKDTGICDRHCAWHFPKARRGQPLLVSWITLDRRPSRGHSDQGSCIRCYSPSLVTELEGKKMQTSRTLESTRPLPRENKKMENPCFLGD